MSKVIIDKIRKSRETQAPAGGYNFTVRRPTDLEYALLRNTDVLQGTLLEKFVEGWELTELDIIPGGDGSLVPFSKELFMEWVADHPEVWGPLCDAIIDCYLRHRELSIQKLGKREAG